jgi:hypothetical protein
MLGRWRVVLAGVVALLPAACELDRSGLDYGAGAKDAATVDAPFLRGEHPSGIGGDTGAGTGGLIAGGVGGGLGEAGGAAGTGGAPDGTGGVAFGSGGAIWFGTGGALPVGTGGDAAGSGGTVGGTGGAPPIGTGGTPIAFGTGGMKQMGTGGFGFMLGTGGTPAGTGGVIITPGIGGMFFKGTGGAFAGTGGQITTTCNSMTCPDGCCAGNACVTKLSAQQCGRGQACQPCAGCERCSTAGACELDPASQWDLIAASAVLNRNDPYYASGTGPWDLTGEQFGGARPDPFCQLDMPVGTPIYGTTSLIDNLAPAWNQPLNAPGTTLTASDLLPGGLDWQIWVGDDDGGGVGEVMCEINAPIAAADFKAGGFMRTNVGSQFSSAPSCTSVTFKLTCHP